MPISIQKKDLFDLMQKAFPIIPLKSSLQILSNFKITYNQPNLEIIATDLDHSLKVTAEATGQGPFDITVSGRKAFDIIRELPDGLVHLDIDENILIIKSEKKFSCKIAGADSHDFPGLPEVAGGSSFEISGFKLRDLILKSGFAVAKDESRACLCGINWEVYPDKTGMVATDGHRLGCSFLSSTFSVDQKISGIMSQKSAGSLLRILDPKGKDETVRVVFGEKYVSFSTSSMIMCSKLVEGPYPDYTKVIPRNNPKEIIIERASFFDAVRRVSVLSNQKTHLVKFSFNEGTLEIMVLNRDIGGEARETIEVEYHGDLHIIGFNGIYFTEILDIIKTQKVRLEMNTQISACLIFPYAEKDTEHTSDDLFLIMPLRIVEEG